jgi:hypothetical protein
MRIASTRFTVRRMMLAMVVLALGLGAYERYFREGYSAVYAVGDLAEPHATFRERDDGLVRLISAMKWSVTPDVWWAKGRRITTFEPIIISRSPHVPWSPHVPEEGMLAVVHTRDGHAQVRAWIGERRAAKVQAQNRAWTRVEGDGKPYRGFRSGSRSRR